jgi:hypothetical protein
MAATINNPPGRSGSGSYRFDAKVRILGYPKRKGVKITIAPVDDMDKSQADSIAYGISCLFKSKFHGIPYSTQQLGFIGGLSDDLYARLTTHDLVAPRESATETISGLTIKTLFDDWKAAHSHLAENSITNHTQAYRSLVRDLEDKKRNPTANGKDTLLSDISVAFGTAHRGWLEKHGGAKPPHGKLAKGTAGKRITWIKQWFTWIIDADRFEGKNPFRKADTSSPSDKSKMHYVKHTQRRELRDAMPTDQLKHIVTLARLQGLRPSDMVMIQVQHVHFGDGTDLDPAMVMIPSIKTGNRQCPMFHPEVQEAYQALTKGKKKKDYLFDRKDFQAVRDGVKTMNDVNIATQVRKYYEAETGKQLWAKPFINMRSSCIIELIEIYKYSEYEVSQCVGNSPKTIRKHYMDLLHADHRREAELEMGDKDTRGVGVNVGVTCPVPPEFVVNLNGSQYVPIEAVQAILEEHKTLRKQHISELLASAPECVVPLRAAIEEMEKVHHRGFEPLTFGSVNRCSIQLS